MRSKKRNLKAFFPLLLILTMLLPLAGCASDNTQSASGDAQNTSGSAQNASGDTQSASGSIQASGADDAGDSRELFTLRVITQTGFNELNVADELGFFRDEGIRLEYIGVLGKGVTEFQLLAQDEIDAFTGSHPPNVAQARLAGIKVTAVAPGMVDDEQYPHVRYLVKKDSPIQSLKEAVGKKVSISSIGACNSGYVQYYLKSLGLDPDKVEFVILNTPGQQEQSLLQGLVDITTSHPPYAGIALGTGEYRQILSTWDIFQSPGAGLSVRGFTDEFIEKHPDVAQGFVNAMYRSRNWIDSNLEDAKKIVAKHLKLEPKDLSNFLYDRKKNITPEYIEKWFEISETIDLWKKGDILPEEIYTNQFVPKDLPAGDAALKWDDN